MIPSQDKNLTQDTARRNFSLNMIYFYLTKGCNLFCRHCWITPQLQSAGRIYPSLPLDKFRCIVEQAMPLGLSGVKLTGGEPLLHPEIHEILELIREKELGCTVETNGVLCTPELAAEMAACKNPFVSVSLDGAEAETHEWVRRVPGCFGRAVEGIRNLVRAGFKPQIIMTLMRRNKEQVGDMVRLAESLGAGSVKFNIMEPMARGEQMHVQGEALNVEELVELGRWVENDLSLSTGLRLIFDYPLSFRSLGRLFGETGDGCSRCGIFGILGVLADGSYALCGIGATVPELVFGHVDTDPLAEVWHSHPLLNEIRRGLPHRLEGVCRECLMKSLCLGSCIAQNYYSRRGFWAPFWFCEEAYRRGCFPDNRLRPAMNKELPA